MDRSRLSSKNVDKGKGKQIQISLAEGTSTTRSHHTRFRPFSDGASSSSSTKPETFNRTRKLSRSLSESAISSSSTNPETFNQTRKLSRSSSDNAISSSSTNPNPMDASEWEDLRHKDRSPSQTREDQLLASRSTELHDLEPRLDDRPQLEPQVEQHDLYQKERRLPERVRVRQPQEFTRPRDQALPLPRWLLRLSAAIYPFEVLWHHRQNLPAMMWHLLGRRRINNQERREIRNMFDNLGQVWSNLTINIFAPGDLTSHLRQSYQEPQRHRQRLSTVAAESSSSINEVHSGNLVRQDSQGSLDSQDSQVLTRRPRHRQGASVASAGTSSEGEGDASESESGYHSRDLEIRRPIDKESL